MTYVRSLMLICVLLAYGLIFYMIGAKANLPCCSDCKPCPCCKCESKCPCEIECGCCKGCPAKDGQPGK